MSRKESLGSKYFLTLIFASVLLSLFGILSHNAFADQVVSTIPVGNEPVGIGVNPNTNMIYVANGLSGSVSVINIITNTVTNTIPVGSYPAGIGVDPNTNKIYVADYKDGIDVIDGSTNSVVNTIPDGSNPASIAINLNTNKIYVANHADNTVYVIDGSTNSVVSTVSVGSNPNYVSVNPNANRIYVANLGGNTVSVIDGSTNSVISTIPVGGFVGPNGVGVNPNTNRIYATSAGGNIVSLIDGSTNSVVTTISVGKNPTTAVVNSNTNRVYVTNSGDGTVSVIDGSTNSVVGTVSVGNQPYDVGINPNTNRIYIVNAGGGTVSVIDGNPTQSLPQAPTNLAANTVSSSQINLSWSAPSKDGNSQITGYMIQRSTDNGTTWSTAVSNTGSNGTTYSDTGLAHSTTYSYRVSTINGIGTSPPSNVASVTTFNVTPSSPTSLTATGKITHIDLTWITPSDNGGTPILGYIIQRSTDNGATWSTIVSDTNSTGTTYTDSHLIPVKVYTYRVSAMNSVGTSDSSNTVSTKPLSIPHLVSVADKDETHFK